MEFTWLHQSNIATITHKGIKTYVFFTKIITTYTIVMLKLLLVTGSGIYI